MTIHTKKFATLALTILIVVNIAIGSGLDNTPQNAGETQLLNARGVMLDGAAGNPAFAGLDYPPRYGLSLLPVSVASWSDKLSPTLDIIDGNITADYLNGLMYRSFELKGRSPEEVSKILTKELRGGTSLYAGFKLSPFVFASRGFGLSVSTFADVETRIPEGPFMLLFSDKDGLVADGKGIDLSDTRVKAMLASEIAFKLGYSTKIPFLGDYLGLDVGAAGMGIKVLLGHAYFSAEMEKGSAVFYDSVSNKYKAKGRLNVLSAGTGFYDDFDYNEKFLINNPVNGPGLGLDFGLVLQNRKHVLSVDMRDVGLMIWNGKEVRKGSASFNSTFTDGFDLNDLPSDLDSLFDLNSAALKPTDKNLLLWLPTSLNIGYAYNLRFEGESSVILNYLTTSLNYKQQLAAGVGIDYTPRLSAGAAFGLLAGYLPVRYGLILGGPERLASSVGVGLDANYLSIDAFYKAVGSPVLQLKRGFEVGGGLTIRWGFPRVEKAKDAPKTAVPETPVDTAASEFFPPEADSTPVPTPVIPDSKPDSTPVPTPIIPDSMPLPAPLPMPAPIPDSAPLPAPVPMPIPDSTPVPMPIIPDSKPDSTPVPAPLPPVPAPVPLPMPDSIPDYVPAPEPVPIPLPSANDALAIGNHQRAINFAPGSATLTEGSYASLRTIADLLSQYPHIRYEVQGHTDSYGAEIYNLLLSAERAAVVKYCLISLGVPEDNLVAVGYGRNIPIADNNTEVGRALNRRVEFVPIQSQEHYDWVKRFELDMIPRLTDRVIKGRAMFERVAPATPTAPVNPINPVNQINQVNPVNPVTPVNPINPINRATPVNQADPVTSPTTPQDSETLP